MSKMVARLLPHYEFDIDGFFRSDGAPGNVAMQRQDAFFRLACLYGGDKDCFDRANAFPNIGAGIQYVIKRKEGIVANLEFAAGKDGNYGLYMKMGYSY